MTAKKSMLIATVFLVVAAGVFYSSHAGLHVDVGLYIDIDLHVDVDLDIDVVDVV